MIPLGPVVARSRVGVTRAAAWTYLVEQDRRAAWWPELQLDPRVGGAVAERWSEGEGENAVSRDAAGTVDVWVDGHAIGFTWREAGDERDTAVLVTLRTQGVDTGITVTETGFDALPAAAERAAASQEGWQVLLRDLATALEAAQQAGEFGARPALDTTDQAASAGTAAAALAGAGDAAGAGSASEPGGEIAIAEPEVDGELDETEGVEAADSDAVPEQIELEAEPAVGDHPELETGPVDVVPSEETNLDETIRIDRAELDAVMAGAPAPAPEAAETALDAEADEPSPAGERAPEPEEPDFDTLIRGS